MRKAVHVCERMVLGVVICLAWASVAQPYEAGEVTNGGTITGKVSLFGRIPEPRSFPMVLYAYGDFCKKISNGDGLVLLREFHVDGEGGLQDAVVAVQDVRRGKAFRYRDTDLVTMNCMFHPLEVPESDQFEVRDGQLVHVHPLVTVMRNHVQLSVTNRDPVDHGAQVYQPEKGNRVLSFPIPVSLKASTGYVDLEEGRQIAQIICETHEYMQTWAWIVDNPYFAKTKKNGMFTIEKLPPGTYKVTAWHPHMKRIEKMVTVPPDGTVSLDFEFDAAQVNRPIYETQRQFRIMPERDPMVDLKGCEGPYCVRREHDHHE
ncbi:MAG: carboxypeptidase regulatory-like domain-containing protein [Nitrospirae bacterium]|nr:carboxypeptidase regulatory-like domain-containing protein [Nitrospirota bacterium]